MASMLGEWVASRSHDHVAGRHRVSSIGIDISSSSLPNRRRTVTRCNHPGRGRAATLNPKAKTQLTCGDLPLASAERQIAKH